MGHRDRAMGHSDAQHHLNANTHARVYTHGQRCCICNSLLPICIVVVMWFIVVTNATTEACKYYVKFVIQY